MNPSEAEELVYKTIQTRAGGAVERCHGIRHMGSYNNAQHQWGVAQLMWVLWPEDFPRLSPYCLFHDTGEFIAGDVPAPTMRYAPGVGPAVNRIEAAVQRDCGVPVESTLDPEDYAKLKACDRLELYIWCREQIAVGNTYVNEVIRELLAFFEETPLPAQAAAFLEHLRGASILPEQSGVMKRLAEEMT